MKRVGKANMIKAKNVYSLQRKAVSLEQMLKRQREEDNLKNNRE